MADGLKETVACGTKKAVNNLKSMFSRPSKLQTEAGKKNDAGDGDSIETKFEGKSLKEL